MANQSLTDKLLSVGSYLRKTVLRVYGCPRSLVAALAAPNDMAHG
jgi:hypothetical protein